MRKLFVVAAFLGALAAPAAADRADDDLAAVKRAVGGPSIETEPKSPAEDPAQPPRRAERDRPRRSEPQWLRVRVVEKGQKRSRVSLNLPLALVRAFGRDWPLEGCRRCEHRTVGEVLRALDSGQNLVEIEDQDAFVRVWVE